MQTLNLQAYSYLGGEAKNTQHKTQIPRVQLRFQAFHPSLSQRALQDRLHLDDAVTLFVFPLIRFSPEKQIAVRLKCMLQPGRRSTSFGVHVQTHEQILQLLRVQSTPAI